MHCCQKGHTSGCPADVESEQASLNTTKETLCGGAAVQNEPWMWPEVGMLGHAAQKKCLLGWHR